jgi:transcriptional regulator with XRE-family HTH domain
MTRNAAAAVPNSALMALREGACLSQREVAERLNDLGTHSGRRDVAVTANTVSRWERGTVTPGHHYRRLLAELFAVPVERLGFSAQSAQTHQAVDTFMDDAGALSDPRVLRSQEEWRRTRRALNATRPALTQLAANVYDPSFRLAGTGLIAHPDWLPARPVNLEAVDLHYHHSAAPPEVDGTEPETANVRPYASLARHYQRYTQAIRDIEHPRLFENRVSWRLIDLAWDGDKARMDFGQTTYFGGVDIYEALAHEMAYVHLGEDGALGRAIPVMRNLPFRRLVGDPFNFARRPVLPSVDTLTIRQDGDDASFVLHRRDPRSVAVAGGMLHVIPSGVFQPSSVLPAAMAADFDLWRNIMREYSEELFGNPEHDGDGQPVRYDEEPFATMDQARQDGRATVWCLGAALDALTLVGEILTVVVFDADTFDAMASDFVEVNDEGSVVNTRVPFTQEAVDKVLGSGRLAPAGAGCIHLAWHHRERLLGW